MECALWYWQYGSVHVSMCEDEREAAEEAHAMQDGEWGAPAGVQYADGRYVDRNEWAEYEAEFQRRRERMDAEIRAESQRPKPPRRTVVPPFDARGKTASVPVDAPSWLGRQVAPSSGEQPRPHTTAQARGRGT